MISSVTSNSVRDPVQDQLSFNESARLKSKRLTIVRYPIEELNENQLIRIWGGSVLDSDLGRNPFHVLQICVHY